MQVCPSHGKGVDLGWGEPLAACASVIQSGYQKREEFSVRSQLKKSKHGNKEEQPEQTLHFTSFPVHPFSLVEQILFLGTEVWQLRIVQIPQVSTASRRGRLIPRLGFPMAAASDASEGSGWLATRMVPTLACRWWLRRARRCLRCLCTHTHKQPIKAARTTLLCRLPHGCLRLKQLNEMGQAEAHR